MATYTKALLSGSTNGQPILVAATSDPGTVIHTAVSGTSSLDEVWLWVDNTDSSNRTITIEYGGNATNNLITQTILAQSGLVLVIPGFLLQNALVVRAYASVTNVLAISGYINQIR